ncbi:YapH protein (fragment) [Xanthomonas citri pv. fuscans]
MPSWDAMTPVGDSGYHTGAFDSPIPASGTWVFAIRARNTNGTLSVAAKYVTKTLGKNLGELQEEMQQAIDQTTEEIRQGFLEAAQRDRELADQLFQQAQDLANLQALVEAPEWVDQAWPAGSIVKRAGGLYVAKQDVPVGTAITDTAYWSFIGQYASLAEAVGAIGVAMQQVTTEVQQVDQELQILAQDVSGVRSSLAGKADASAVQAMNTRLTQAENNVTSLSQLIGTVQSTLSGKADTSALQALQSQVSQQGNEINAQSTAITSVTSKLGGRPNILPNGGFESGIWTNGSASGFRVSEGSWGRIMTHASPWSIGSGGQAVASSRFPINAGETLTVSWDSVLFAQAGQVSMDIEWFRADGTYISSSTRSPIIRATHNFMDGDARRQERAFTRTPPTGCTQAQVRLIWESVVGCTALGFRRVKVEYGALPATPYSADATVVGQASATQSLTTRVTRAENGVASYEAAATLALDVNGRVAGIRSVNNGATATIDFAFDRVRFIGVDAGQGRNEIVSGKIYCYAPNGVQVIAMGAGV